MKSLINKINSIETDSDIIKFIKSLKESDYGYYNGTNVDGETIVVFLGADGYRVSTYQSNGWIRINEYIVDNDEVIRNELYEKGDE